MIITFAPAIKCQLRFGGKKELATDIDSRVICLCSQLEAIFIHGLKKNIQNELPNKLGNQLVNNISSISTNLKYFTG